ncbi:thermonuclease family protein [Deinococcus roseus]|uniref:TNase-like domain-containing protein n=1 Tax=Deinococcus roseus TaxID=392414 RepID=A0ABQ2D815_9DEIO|nr:thermonuclease family protein [Deinococcus roseus]GGJ47898.1 hypothetical protein GCM10008938_37370 [Deinococcus roseus]
MSWSGLASVVDGDTLLLHGQKHRLWGIDAPESSQSCLDGDNKSFRCGQQVALRLADKIRHKTITCVKKDQDRYGRMVSVCSIQGDSRSLNAWLVSQGNAFAYTQYSRSFLPEQQQAKTKKLGLWSGRFQWPWEYRKNPQSPLSTTEVYYRNCKEVRAAGVAPLHQGQPGYRAALDQDQDRLACE